jgi:hypothetical protein
MTPCFNPELALSGVVGPASRRGGWTRFFLAQRAEAFDDFAIRVGECEDLRDIRMPHGMSET